MISPCYPTGDHYMPWKLFAILAADLEHLVALELLQMSEAIGLAFEPDPLVRQDTKDRAFPEVGEPPAPDVLFSKEPNAQ